MFKLEAIEPNELIVQGQSSITFDDLDGYASTIPYDKQTGFFESPKRIDTVLNTLLTMKHVTNYAKKANFLDEVKISRKVSEYLQVNEQRIIGLNMSDFDYLKLKNHLLMKYSYMFMQTYIRDSVEEKDLVSLAEEHYEVNKESYYHKKLMDIQYINVNYTADNKAHQLVLAKEIRNNFKQNKIGFSEAKSLYKSKADVEFIDEINDFYYNIKYKIFSDYVFKTNEVGLHKDILDAESRFIIAIILKITPEGYKKFSEVKQNILTPLKKEKVKREFGELILKLTTAKIEINKDAIVSLKNRYKHNLKN